MSNIIDFIIANFGCILLLLIVLYYVESYCRGIKSLQKEFDIDREADKTFRELLDACKHDPESPQTKALFEKFKALREEYEVLHNYNSYLY